MNHKLSATVPRRPAQRRVSPHAKRLTANSAVDDSFGDTLLAHWTAMQQAMVATGAQRS